MNEQYYYGHGKLLISGEYLVLDGAKALALPTKLGQRMYVKHRPSNSPKLIWKSYDEKGELWLEASFEIWKFKCLSGNEDNPEVKRLQEILIQARKQNIHFLRDECDTYVETVLEFPRKWGLGSSSTLVYNIAQWAYISPFELQSNIFKGSGYDIACAQSMGPIKYQVNKSGPSWETLDINSNLRKNIYFIYLNEKKNSREAIQEYYSLEIKERQKFIDNISFITEEMVNCIDLKSFEELLYEHENILSECLRKPRVKEERFSNYWGAIKSLGAWGGDFILATSDRSINETKKYFNDKGYMDTFTYEEFILSNFEKFSHSIDKAQLDPLQNNEKYS